MRFHEDWMRQFTPRALLRVLHTVAGRKTFTNWCCSCCSLSRVWLFAAPRTAAHEAPPSFTISQSLLKLMSIVSMMPSNHLILSCPLLLLPSTLPSIRVFSNELALHIRWPKYWSFSFSVSPSSEYSRLILFRIDWFALLAVIIQ